LPQPKDSRVLLTPTRKEKGFNGPHGSRAGKASRRGDADLPDDRMVYRRLSEAREMVDQNSANWNRIASWLRQIDGLH